ncbi:MAG: FAD-dependent thymidylate synthase [Candidatus Blackburnbacteria bacterium]|nr:FAD-dependent thymidylate synthase [Candidatus Blackburnbacteria bacterium]
MAATKERLLQTKTVEAYLSEYLKLGENLVDPPKMKLVLPDGINRLGARDVAVTTSVQCYAPGIAPMRQRQDGRSEAIADSTLEAGHHTTRQHVSYTWLVQGVSRSATHDIFHSHPFYNSEQQSQRYVEAVSGSYLVPTGLSGEQRQLYTETADLANRAYFKLLELLKPEVGRREKAMHPRGKWAEVIVAERTIKASQEIARYVLPIAQKTNYYHDLSELQLLRLFRASQMPHFTDEARYVIAQMIVSIAKEDPTIIKDLRVPINDFTTQAPTQFGTRFTREVFDTHLGGRQSLLISFPQNGRGVILAAARRFLGGGLDLSDSQVLGLVMDPAKNHLLADMYDVGMFDYLTDCLRLVSATFITRLSHTADSQRQRHRRTHGVTLPVAQMYNSTPDYIIPKVVRETPQLREAYEKILGRVYEGVNKCLDSGMSREQALLLLPNAHVIKVTETGDLFDWFHRLRQRLCFLAQEEFFFISCEQALQLRGVLPEAKSMFLAPCGIRSAAGIRPRCPEDKRWCGQPVFNWEELEEYTAKRLI